MSLTFKHNTIPPNANNPAYPVSKDAWSENHSLAGGTKGDVLLYDPTDGVPNIGIATPGTADYALLSNGAGALPSFRQQTVRTASVSYSLAQIQAGNTTPQTIVAALGANKIIVPLHMAAYINFGGTNFNTSQTLRCRYAGDATDLASINAFIGNAGPSGFGVAPFSGGSVYITRYFTVFDPRNKALQISLSGDLTGGTGSTMKVWVQWVEYDLS